MKKTILSLVCLMMMSAMSVSAKRVVYVSNHHPAQRTEMVVVHKDKQHKNKHLNKHLKKHHGQHKGCKKCQKWRAKHAKHNAKMHHHKIHKHSHR